MQDQIVLTNKLLSTGISIPHLVDMTGTCLDLNDIDVSFNGGGYF